MAQTFVRASDHAIGTDLGTLGFTLKNTTQTADETMLVANKAGDLVFELTQNTIVHCDPVPTNSTAMEVLILGKMSIWTNCVVGLRSDASRQNFYGTDYAKTTQPTGTAKLFQRIGGTDTQLETETTTPFLDDGVPFAVRATITDAGVVSCKWWQPSAVGASDNEPGSATLTHTLATQDIASGGVVLWLDNDLEIAAIGLGTGGDPAPAKHTASTTATLAAGTGRQVVTLTSWAGPDVFGTTPVAGDQIEGPDTLTIGTDGAVSGPDGSYSLRHIAQDGTWTQGSYTHDATGPVLSAPNAAASGENAVSVTVTTDEGNGTLYAVATGNSTETATYVVNNGITQGVTGIGEQAFSFSGLQPGTAYYVHFLQRDAAGNDSNVVSSAQVVTAGGASSAATTTVNWTPGTGWTSPVTLVAPIEPYAFEQWASPPVAGEQLFNQTGDGSWDQNGNFETEKEAVMPMYFVGLDGQIHRFSLDSTGLSSAGGQADTTAPVLTLTGGDFNLSAGSSYVEPGYSASDNVDGDVTANVTVSGSVNTSVPGTYTLTYSVSDAAGNVGSAQRRVTVVDDTAPVITLTGDNPMTITQGTPYSEPGYSATDNVDGDVTADVVVTGSVDHLTPGTYTRNYVVTDAAGNQGSQTRTVTVQQAPNDTIPDAFLFNSKSEQPFSTLVEFNAITVTGVDPDTDVPVSIAGDPSSQYAVSTDGGSTWGGWTSTGTNVRLNYQIKVRHNTSPYGSTNVTSTLTVGGVDGSAVSTTKPGDTVKPVITLVGGDVTLVEGTPYSEPGYAATDNTDGNLTGSVVVTGTVDHNTPGLYVISYTVQDAAGNNATTTRLVLVEEDVQPPVITLVGGANAYVPLDGTWTEPGYSANDNRDGDLTANVSVAGTVDTAVPGFYSLTYTVTDAKGNSATATRVVRVGSGYVSGAGTNLRNIVQPIATSL